VATPELVVGPAKSSLIPLPESIPGSVTPVSVDESETLTQPDKMKRLITRAAKAKNFFMEADYLRRGTAIEKEPDGSRTNLWHEIGLPT
jgi:hypothetical protein